MKETSLDVFIVLLQFVFMDRCIKQTRKPEWIEKFAENVRKLTKIEKLGLQDDVIAIALAALASSGEKRTELINKGIQMVGEPYLTPEMLAKINRGEYNERNNQ